MQQITLLGATGSIGDSTLSVVDLHPDKFRIFALSANTNWQKMLTLCEKYQPDFAVMSDKFSAEKLQNSLSNTVQVLAGEQAICEVAAHPQTDTVMAAIVGAAGMPSALAAAKAGKRIMLANKESLVLAGDIFTQAINQNNAELIPVDSEHSAIFQCLQNGTAGLSKIQLTASGGPFLHTPLEQLKTVTPEQACTHPNWSMGQKISVDSATMMNKGLEVIEAHYLFALPANQIDVVVHPQSIMHSCVHYQDGSILAQLGKPDMRSAVAYALSYPKRIKSGVKMLDLAQNPPLEFYPPDLDKFACLSLAFAALKVGGGAMGTLNAANEVAVAAFLKGKISFLSIPKIIETTLEKSGNAGVESLQAIIENDKNARRIATELL